MKIFLLFIVVSFAVSCANENGDYTSLHPIQEKMSYANSDAKKLKILDGGDFLKIFPESVQLLYNFLNNEFGNLNAEELQILTTNDIDVKSINNSDLLILEKDEARLIQFNLNNNEYVIIANKGRGPGDLFFPKELSVNKGQAFVGMQAFQISMFSCESKLCEYDKTFNTEFNNYSVAPVDDFIKFLGVKPFGLEQYPDPSNIDQNLIHKMDYNSEINLSFFPIYDFRSSIVREKMHSGGQVRSFPEIETIVITFDFFPYLYLFNEVGELITKYEIPEYIQAYYESEKSRNGGFTGRLIYGSNSNISHTMKLDDRWLLMRIREQRDVEFISMEEGFDGYEWFSYYAFDVEEKKYIK